MLADSFFEQGVTHEVCEDYALNGQEYVILSDGCSNSGGPRIDSDWGARLLAKAAERYVFMVAHEHFTQIVGSEAAAWQRTMSLRPECLVATLLMLRPLNGYTGIEGYICGDGVFGAKYKNGWKVYTIEFLPGGTRQCAAPFYLKYKIAPRQEEAWKKDFGGRCVVKMYWGNLFAPGMEYPSLSLPTYESRARQWAEHFHCIEAEQEFDTDNPYFLFNFPIEDCEYVFGCTDGVQSFYEQRGGRPSMTTERVHLFDVLRVLLDMKIFRPGFARTQREWVFKTNRPGTFRRMNWQNFDDVSLGVIYCGDPKDATL